MQAAGAAPVNAVDTATSVKARVAVESGVGQPRRSRSGEAGRHRILDLPREDENRLRRLADSRYVIGGSSEPRLSEGQHLATFNGRHFSV